MSAATKVRIGGASGIGSRGVFIVRCFHQRQGDGNQPELGHQDDIVGIIAQPVQVDETKNKPHCPRQEPVGESWLGKHAAPQAVGQD